MSNDAPINVPDHSLAKRRLARDLRRFVIGQAISLFVAVLGVLVCYIVVLLNGPPGGDLHAIGFILASIGIIVSVVVAFLGFSRLAVAAFLPVRIHCYTLGGFVLFLLLFVLAHYDVATTLYYALLYIFPLYGIIPQFFIVRWLAKEVEDGTIQAMDMTEQSLCP